MLDPRISTRLKELVLNLDRAGVEKATREALEAGDSPQDIISEGLSRGMEEVGERFERREFFLPELMPSTLAMALVGHSITPGYPAQANLVLTCVCKLFYR